MPESPGSNRAAQSSRSHSADTENVFGLRVMQPHSACNAALNTMPSDWPEKSANRNASRRELFSQDVLAFIIFLTNSKTMAEKYTMVNFVINYIDNFPIGPV